MHDVGRAEVFLKTSRYPAEDLCAESFATVHQSLLGIAKMRLSIERAQVQVGRAWNAILDSKALLERLRLEDLKP